MFCYTQCRWNVVPLYNLYVCNFDVDVVPSSLPMLTTQESTLHSYVIIILLNRKCITFLFKKNIVLNLNKNNTPYIKSILHANSGGGELLCAFVFINLWKSLPINLILSDNFKHKTWYWIIKINKTYPWYVCFYNLHSVLIPVDRSFHWFVTWRCK